MDVEVERMVIEDSSWEKYLDIQRLPGDPV